MDRMVAPEVRNFVISAVVPVLGQVGNENAQQQLRHEPDVLYRLLKIAADEPRKSMVDHEVRGEQYQAHQEMIDGEVREICLPFGAKNGLPFVQREQFLEQYEYQGRPEQVENEPVEADIGGVVRKVAHRHARTAERHCPDHDGKGQCVQIAASTND